MQSGGIAYADKDRKCTRRMSVMLKDPETHIISFFRIRSAFHN